MSCYEYGDIISGRLSSKCTYRYIVRKSKSSHSNNGGSRRKMWMELLQAITESKQRLISWFQKNRCFQKVDYDFFMAQSRDILSSTPLVRRTIVDSMIGSDGNFFFNGKKKFVRFLKKTFHQSTVKIASHRLRLQTIAEQSPIPMSELLTSKSSLLVPHSAHREAIVSYLTRIAECSEKIPDRDELHLLLFQKELYQSSGMNKNSYTLTKP